MIGIDTNVLVRYLTKDDQSQTERAVKFIKSLTPAEKRFISLAVIVE